MVPGHRRILLSVSLRSRHFSELLREALLVLILFHVLQVPFDLRLELIERGQLLLVLGRALLIRRARRAKRVLPIRFLQVYLQVAQIVLEPVGRRLLQIDAHEL